MVNTVYKLPAHYELLLERFATAPTEVRATWRYALITMLIEDGILRIDTFLWSGRQLTLNLRNESDESFKIARPPMSFEAELSLVAELRLRMGEPQSTPVKPVRPQGYRFLV